MPSTASPVYRYGHGRTVIHILPPGPAGAVPSLCRAPRTIFWAKGAYPRPNSLYQVCKRCEALWREATGAPAPKRPAGPVVRDVQKSRLYASEAIALRTGRTFRSEEEALAYAKALLASDWAERHFGVIRLHQVRFTHGLGAYSYTGRRMITLGVGQRHERTLIHEIAHQIVEQAYGRSVQAHGPLFARIVHTLAQHKLGVAQARQLLACYRENRVKVASPALVARKGARPTDWPYAMHEGRVPA